MARSVCYSLDMTQTKSTDKVRIDTAAPVSARFIGCTGRVISRLGNAVIMEIDGHGRAILHQGWGTRRNPGNLVLTPVA